jgi:hypothetical protein
LEKLTADLLSGKQPEEPLELMDLDLFNKLLDPLFQRFTEETYTVDVVTLKNKKDHIKEVKNDSDVTAMLTQKDRNTRLMEKWNDFKLLKADWARRKGRIAEFRYFRDLNKKVCSEEGLKLSEVWKQYQRTWWLLMGLKPSARLFAGAKLANEPAEDDDDNWSEL